jgi:hypothetical protein
MWPTWQLEPYSMAVNKTLYVKDEDASVWEEARELTGDKLSAFLTAHLRTFVETRRAQTKGYDRIVLKYIENARPVSKAFFGRWIIDPEERWYSSDLAWKRCYAVASTAKGNVVVLKFEEASQQLEGFFDSGDLFTYPSMGAVADEQDEMRQPGYVAYENAGPRLPSDLITIAMERIGIETEELDI